MINYDRPLYILTQKILTLLLAPLNFRISKRTLLLNRSLSQREKELLRQVSLKVHRNDGMYLPADGRHYFSVGLSALRCIERALEADRRRPVRSVLDFPCGYGRVARFLRARFPEAFLVACDIEKPARDFCGSAFAAGAVRSDKDFKRLGGRLARAGEFDLIWCGSLFTHLAEPAAFDLLELLHGRLAPGGLCVFTTHGRYSHWLILKKKYLYALNTEAQQKILAGYQATGYGYADYLNSPGYGISLVTEERMRALARAAGQWREIYFLDRGWDNHQDVWAFARDGTPAGRG